MGRIHTDTVRRIRRYSNAGYTVPELVEHFKLEYMTVYRIVNRLTFTNVADISEDDLPLLSNAKHRTARRESNRDRRKRAEETERNAEAYPQLAGALAAGARQAR